MKGARFTVQVIRFSYASTPFCISARIKWPIFPLAITTLITAGGRYLHRRQNCLTLWNHFRAAHDSPLVLPRNDNHAANPPNTNPPNTSTATC